MTGLKISHATPATKSLLTGLALPVVAAIAVVLICASIGGLLASEFHRSRTLREDVRESYDRRAQLQDVLSLHQDIETGQRGYVLTGKEVFLEPYIAALPRIERSLGALETSLGPDFPLKQELSLLRALSARKLRLSKETIELRRAGRTERSIAIIAEGSGKRAMDGIRHVVRNIDEVEREQLRERLDRSRKATAWTEKLSLGLQILLLLLLAGAGCLIARSFFQKQAAIRRVQDLNARQAAIFDAAKDGIIVLNRSGSIESLNPAAARIFGYSPDDLVRRDVGVLFEVAPDRGKFETFLKRLQRRRHGDRDAVQEIWAKRHDGSTFPADVSVSPVHLVDTVRYVAIVRDSSERKQIEQMKTEFVSTVSHELRTPLTSIAGALGLIRGGAVGTLPGPALRLIEVAHSNAQRLIRLVNDILDIEKIESGSIDFEIKPLPLQSLLAQTVEANRSFAAEHQVRLVLDPVPEQARVMADSDRLAQVVTNLVSNAAKFSPAGRVVRISVAQLDRRYRIIVADRGPGIPQEFRTRIFNKFAQADSSDTRQRGGTGLGLSIVREIATRLGGSVSFEDRAGGGTCFNVDLPAAAEPPPQQQSEPASPSGALLRVLHIEDDPDIAQLTSAAFGKLAAIESVSTLEAASATLALKDYDVVILDIGLPDGTGTDLLSELPCRIKKGTSLVVFSAEEVPQSTVARADAVLIKSRASLDDLVETVLGLADRKQRRVAG